MYLHTQRGCICNLDNNSKLKEFVLGNFYFLFLVVWMKLHKILHSKSDTLQKNESRNGKVFMKNKVRNEMEKKEVFTNKTVLRSEEEEQCACVESIKRELKISSETFEEPNIDDIDNVSRNEKLQTFLSLGNIEPLLFTENSSVDSSQNLRENLLDKFSCSKDCMRDRAATCSITTDCGYSITPSFKTVVLPSTTYAADAPCLLHGRSTSTRNTAEKLLQQEKMPLQQDMDGDTILHILIAKKDNERIIQCIPKCVTGRKGINAVNNMGQTALHLALYQEMLGVATCLLQNGAQTSLFDSSGSIPLHIACDKDSVDFVTVLLKLDTESDTNMINMKNSVGLAPIHIATLKENVLNLRILYEYGADVNSQECKSGKTGLLIAMERYNYNLAKLFIKEFSADVNVATYSGFYPLHYACVNNNEEMAKLLLQAGSSVGNRTVEMKSEKDLAQTTEIKTLLERAYRRKRRRKQSESLEN